MPFITEELWGNMAVALKCSSMRMAAYGSELIDTDADHEMNWVISLIEEIRSVRMQCTSLRSCILMLSMG